MRGYGAYAKVQTATRSHRDTEYELLGKVTGALLRAESPEAAPSGTLQSVALER